MPEEEFDTDSDRHLADEALASREHAEAKHPGQQIPREIDAGAIRMAVDFADAMEAEMKLDAEHGFDFAEWNSMHQLLVQTQQAMIQAREQVGLTNLKQRTELSRLIEQVTVSITKVAYWGNKAIAVHQDKINEMIKDIKTPIMPIVRK